MKRAERTQLWHRFQNFLRRCWHSRPLAWLEPNLIALDSWRPDPPVMERLLR